MLRQNILPVVLAAIWISVSEFFRNEFLLQAHWHNHYASMGLDFPNAPVNGMVWGLWSLGLAIGLQSILRKFEFWRAIALTWFMAFVLMWLVTGNMAVLPLGLLVYAIPLSIVEVTVAAWILHRLSKAERPD